MRESKQFLHTHEVTRSNPSHRGPAALWLSRPADVTPVGGSQGRPGLHWGRTTAPPYRHSSRSQIDKITGGDEAMPDFLRLLSRTEVIDAQPYARCSTARFIKLPHIDVALRWIRPCSDRNKLRALLAPLSARPGNREGPCGPHAGPDRCLIAHPGPGHSFSALRICKSYPYFIQWQPRGCGPEPMVPPTHPPSSDRSTFIR